MTLPPRAVLIHRRTELAELLARHGTRGQAAFFLESRGRRIEDMAARHHAVRAAITAITAVILTEWRSGMVERADLPRFLFEPSDVVIAVGQDGLVANLAKYLTGQIVVDINPEPARNPGILVPHPPEAASALLATAASPRAGQHAAQLSMVTAITDDGQQLVALNEIYLGQATHQTARYTLTDADQRSEAQASSGIIVSTGTGATGWCRSAWLECQLGHSITWWPDPINVSRKLAPDLVAERGLLRNWHCQS